MKDLLDEQRKLSLAESCNKANIFLGLIEYELNSLLGTSHLVNYISVHIRFDLEIYLLIINSVGMCLVDRSLFEIWLSDEIYLNMATEFI